MDNGLLGLFFVAVLVVLLTALIAHAPFARRTRLLIISGLWLRVFGSLAYLYGIGGYYGGGDYLLYYEEGLKYAELLHAGSWESAVAPWMRAGWWGSAATIRISGIALAVLGATLPGAFILFAVAGYAGIIALWLAFSRAFPEARDDRYLAWLVLFPSLWFWPAAMGKDALVLLGVGLAAAGFIGKNGRTRFALTICGTLLVFMIRPQVAAVLIFSAVAAHWVSQGVGWRLSTVVQGLMLLALGWAVTALAGNALGVGMFSPDEIDTYLVQRGYLLSLSGGTVMEVEEGGISLWMAPINTLARPFVWEAHSPLAAAAALEVLVVWSLGWFRRREIKGFVSRYRRTKLFWFAVILMVTYSTALGLVATNFGVLVRQRVHVLPFVFMFFAGLRARRPAAHAGVGSGGVTRMPRPLPSA